jgi:hypothetical protein
VLAQAARAALIATANEADVRKKSQDAIFPMN